MLRPLPRLAFPVADFGDSRGVVLLETTLVDIRLVRLLDRSTVVPGSWLDNLPELPLSPRNSSLELLVCRFWTVR